MGDLMLILVKALTGSIINTIGPHHFGIWPGGPCYTVVLECWIKQDWTDLFHRGFIRSLYYTDLYFECQKRRHSLQSISIFDILWKHRLTFLRKANCEMLLYIIVLCVFIMLMVNVQEGYKHHLLFESICFLTSDCEELEPTEKMCISKNAFKFI